MKRGRKCPESSADIGPLCTIQQWHNALTTINGAAAVKYSSRTRQYCLRKLLGHCKSWTGRGFQLPRPVASRVERTASAHHSQKDARQSQQAAAQASTSVSIGG